MKPVRGFSLIEMAVVLIVLVLLLGGALVPLATQVEHRKIAETEKAMEEAKEALIGFALANSRLPCPDRLNNDGIEDPPCNATIGDAQGSLPWRTLSVPRADAWGRLFRYRVSRGFIGAATFPCTAWVPPPGTNDPNLGLCDRGEIDINTRNPTTKAIQPLVTDAAAIIVSYGKNGFSATTETGFPIPNPPVSNADENQNIGGDEIYVTRTITPLRTPCSDTAAGAYCEFDDIVVWLSPNILFNRMVAAGRLP